MDISLSNTTDGDLALPVYINVTLSRSICLFVFIVLLIPSILLAFYVFYWIFRQRELRNRLTNHIIISIFVVSFIQVTCEMPFLLKYFINGHVAFDSFYFCKFWIAFNYSLNTTILFLNAHLAVERYLLIFHNIFINQHKVLIHYLPMVVIIMLAIGYSSGTVVFYPCQDNYDYTRPLCGGPCFQIEPVMGMIDVVVTIFIPLPCIICFNIFLCVRVIQQKRRMLQRQVWRKNRGMLIQLLAVSILHCVVWMPVILVIIITLASSTPSDIIIQLQSSWVLINIIYLAVLINPLVCIFAIPEIKERFGHLIERIRERHPQQLQQTGNNQILPLTTHVNRTSRRQGQ